MKKLSKFFILQINGLFPFLYPLLHTFKNFNFFKGISYYYRDLIRYRSLNSSQKTLFPIKLENLYPIYFDRFEEAGEVPKHYFYMDLWAAKKIYESNVKMHYDIGSRIDSFISHCLVFCKVTMLDVRPLKSFVPNLKFIQANCMDMKNIKSNTIGSLSSLHAVEHFGLGRYGDPIDPLGYDKAIGEIKRITKLGGDVYFAGPIGRQRVEFNAHRVVNPLFVVKLFEGFQLLEFSAIDDENNFIEKTKPEKFVKANYSCGLFHFRKISNDKSKK